MRINFECSGGFANLKLTYNVDTNTLPHELAKELLELIEDSGFFKLQQNEVTPKSPGPPDVFSYRLSLHESGKKKSLFFNDVTVPASLRPLLGHLQKLAVDKKRKGK